MCEETSVSTLWTRLASSLLRGSMRIPWDSSGERLCCPVFQRPTLAATFRRTCVGWIVPSTCRCAALGVVGTMTLPRVSHSRDDDVLVALSLCLKSFFFFFHEWCRSRIMVPGFHGTKGQISTLSVAGRCFFMILNGWDDRLVIDLVFSESRYQVRYWLLYLTATYKYSVGYSKRNN